LAELKRHIAILVETYDSDFVGTRRCICECVVMHFESNVMNSRSLYVRDTKVDGAKAVRVFDLISGSKVPRAASIISPTTILPTSDAGKGRAVAGMEQSRLCVLGMSPTAWVATPSKPGPPQ
jgi:hypothetical protein